MTNQNQLSIFNNKVFGEVRSIMHNKEVYFIGIDIAKALGYSNASKAISTHCKNGVKIMLEADAQNGNVVKTQTTIIQESDLYRLIIKSKLPQALEFEKWLMEEVLPQIRKTGKYSTNPLDNLDISDVIVKVIESLKPIIDKYISEQIPTNQLTNKSQDYMMDTVEVIAHLRASGMSKAEAEYSAYRIRAEFNNNTEAINYILKEFHERRYTLKRKKASVEINTLIEDITQLDFDWHKSGTWAVFDEAFYKQTGINLLEEVKEIQQINIKHNRIDVLIKYNLISKAKRLLKEIYKANTNDLIK